MVQRGKKCSVFTNIETDAELRMRQMLTTYAIIRLLIHLWALSARQGILYCWGIGIGLSCHQISISTSSWKSLHDNALLHLSLVLIQHKPAYSPCRQTWTPNSKRLEARLCIQRELKGVSPVGRFTRLAVYLVVSFYLDIVQAHSLVKWFLRFCVFSTAIMQSVSTLGWAWRATRSCERRR